MVQTIGNRDLREHSGEVVLFQRGDVALEGRLFYDCERKSEAEYVVVPINGYCVRTPWDKIRTGLGVRNHLHDTWDIPVMGGDVLCFDYKTAVERVVPPEYGHIFSKSKILAHEIDDSAKRYEVLL